MDRDLICIDKCILLGSGVQGSLCVVVVIEAQCLALYHISHLEVYECINFHDFTAGKSVNYFDSQNRVMK